MKDYLFNFGPVADAIVYQEEDYKIAVEKNEKGSLVTAEYFGSGPEAMRIVVSGFEIILTVSENIFLKQFVHVISTATVELFNWEEWANSYVPCNKPIIEPRVGYTYPKDTEDVEVMSVFLVTDPEDSSWLIYSRPTTLLMQMGVRCLYRVSFESNTYGKVKYYYIKTQLPRQNSIRLNIPEDKCLTGVGIYQCE